MKEYAEFIKEGNFSPMSVLNPEMGMDSAIFAQDRASHVSGAVRGLSGRMTGMSSDQDNFHEEKERVNLEEAHAQVTDMLTKIEEKAKNTKDAFATVLEKPVEKRYKGRRRKISVGEDISHLSGLEQGRDLLASSSAHSSRSSGYQSQTERGESSSSGRIGERADDFGDEGIINITK